MYSVYMMMWLHHVADFVISAIILVHKLSSYKVVSSITISIKIYVILQYRYVGCPFHRQAGSRLDRSVEPLYKCCNSIPVG